MSNFLIFIVLFNFSLFSVRTNNIQENNFENLVRTTLKIEVFEPNFSKKYSCAAYLISELINDNDNIVNDALNEHNIQGAVEVEKDDVSWSPVKLLTITREIKAFDLLLPKECYKVTISLCSKYLILYCFASPQDSSAIDLIIVPLKNIFAISGIYNNQTFEIL